MKYLSIDYGKSRTGLAVTDSKGKIVIPYKTITEKNLDNLIKIIKQTVKELKIEKIIIGYPLNVNNTKSAQTLCVDEFISKLKTNINEIAIEIFNEKYSSNSADFLLKNMGLNRKERAKRIDEISALVILKNYLNLL